MFARIEVAMRPEFSDPAALTFLRKVELAHPEIRRKIRWARILQVYWIDLPIPREDMIPAITVVFWDRVLQWLLTGNLIPSAAGERGGLADLFATAPNRPGKFWGVERRFRAGVTDNVGRTAVEAFEIVLNRKFSEPKPPKSNVPNDPDASHNTNVQIASGSLLLLEGAELNEDMLTVLARDVYCNELIETWTLLPVDELEKNNRFHQERIKRDLPKLHKRSLGDATKKLNNTLNKIDEIDEYELASFSDAELVEMSETKLWALSLAEMKAIQSYFARADILEHRKKLGLSKNPTDVEMEVIAQTWSEHCKHKIFAATIKYRDLTTVKGKTEAIQIPSEIHSLFKTTISGTTAQLHKPWLLSVFEDNAGIVAFDEEDAFCIKVETHNSPSALDPYGGALTGIVGVNRDILGCGLGAKPIFNTDVFCVAPLDYSKTLPERLLHPRRILDGVRLGVEHGGNKSGIPTVNGALVFDERYLGKPLVYCGTGGLMPRRIGERACEVKEIKIGDRICMVGGRIGKDGIHGATFSSMALNEGSPVSAVQLGDPITQKRVADFLLEARDLGLYRAITDNGAGGLSSSVGELARISGVAASAPEGVIDSSEVHHGNDKKNVPGGARMDVSVAKTKYAGLKPYELVVSESQERMTIAVPPEQLARFMELAERRGVEVSDLGEFTDSGCFDIFMGEQCVGSLELEFLHDGLPTLEIDAEWRGRPPVMPAPPGFGAGSDSSGSKLGSFEVDGARALLTLLSRPNIASKEWLISQYDHEVQGTSVVKPLHTAHPGSTAAGSGPNDAAVLKPKPFSDLGLAVGSGINPKLSDIDPYLMAQAAVDEAVRNVLCVGAEFGGIDAVMTLVDNFCWPDPVHDKNKAAALVRACYGLQDAALALSIPLVSGKDSMKNDFRGRRDGKPVVISVVPTLLITAVARVPDVKLARTADFKVPGDTIYVIGGTDFGLLGSEFHLQYPQLPALSAPAKVGEPHWLEAGRIYCWIGRAIGQEQIRLKSLHDISEGGLLVSVAESLLARKLGARLEFPANFNAWEFCFGEGFHSFVASVADADTSVIEAELTMLKIPFQKIGKVMNAEKLEVFQSGQSGQQGGGQAGKLLWSVATGDLVQAWQKKGYWE